jgi:hypothetical protein
MGAAMIRSAETLRRDQTEIMTAFRADSAGRNSVAQLPRPGGALSPAVYGRVSSVVASDPDHGPHLMVTRQVWSGTPPTVSAASGPEVRCYPCPNHVVSDYAVNDYVRIVAAYGAMVSEPLP